MLRIDVVSSSRDEQKRARSRIVKAYAERKISKHRTRIFEINVKELVRIFWLAFTSKLRYYGVVENNHIYFLTLMQLRRCTGNKLTWVQNEVDKRIFGRQRSFIAS